jgi:hypothetical protein
MMSVSANELAKRLGVSYRQLNHWSVQGWLTPDGNVTGTGHQQFFSGFQITKAGLMADLVLAGVAPAKAAALASGDWAAIVALGRALTACRARHASPGSVVAGG